MQPEMMYVYAVYQEGSFSKAAEKLYLTQPALSMSIQKIEQSIGMPLFDRSRRPLQLTDAGEIYIETVKKMLLLEQEQQQRLNDIRNVVTGTIQLGGSHYLNAYILPEILAGFSREYPGVELKITEEASDTLYYMLEENKLDLTFSCNPRLVKNFERYEMFEDHILLAVPEDHPVNEQYQDAALSASDILAGKHLEANCPKVDLRQFSELDFILLSKGNNLYERAWAMFREADMEPKVKLNLSQLVTAYRMAAANMGAAFVSDRVVKEARISLKFYSIHSRHTTRMFYILLPNKAYTPAAVRKFIRYVQEKV